MYKKLTLVLWIAVLVASLGIQVLFVVRVAGHPKSVIDRCNANLSFVQSLVPATLRAQAGPGHADVRNLIKRFVRGFREATNVAGLIALLSVFGILAELKRNKIQPQARSVFSEAAPGASSEKRSP